MFALHGTPGLEHFGEAQQQGLTRHEAHGPGQMLGKTAWLQTGPGLRQGKGGKNPA